MLKLIACLTMIIDHIGVIFFPSMLIFRIIGRLSMPLFAYSLAKGFKYWVYLDICVMFIVFE